LLKLLKRPPWTLGATGLFTFNRKSMDFKQLFPNASLIEHQGHIIPLELTPPSSIKDFSKLFFPCPRGVISVAGADRTSFLNGLGPTDLRQFKPGEGRRMLITNQHGHLLFDSYIWGLEDRILIFAEPGEEHKLIQFMQFYAITEAVEFRQLEPTDFEFCVTFGYAKSSVTGCFEIEKNEGFAVLGAPNTISLSQSLLNLGFLAIGFELYEELRPMVGLARSGVDFSSENLPQEAGLEPYMSFQKGCYLGQEPISRIAFRGRVRKHLEQITSDEPLSAGQVLTGLNGEVGQVTSPSNLQSTSGYHALAYLSAQAHTGPIWAGSIKVFVPAKNNNP